MGAEYVTVGSDTHGAERVGARIGEAVELGPGRRDPVSWPFLKTGRPRMLPL